MANIKQNFTHLQESYLFSKIASRANAMQELHPDIDIIRLGIGDVTLPLAPAVIEALHRAVDEQAETSTFKGYGPELGYDFLRNAIALHDFQSRGCDISSHEIVISDGSKSDAANIQELFSDDAVVAVGDPVYPVYVDSNIMAGRTGVYENQHWSDLIYLPATAENNFVMDLPKRTPDIIYLCFPNNPTGTVLTKDQLQVWVDYANAKGAVIIFDAAYEAYITDPSVPHSIYECEGARNCAIELRSFSKRAGFTGIRLGFTVIPDNLKVDGVSLLKLWSRRQSSKFNGAPYIVQRAGEAIYTPQGKKEVDAQIAYYLENARIIRESLEAMGLDVYGGENAPYIWLKTPDSLPSWDYFDLLLEHAHVLTTPGSGFGPHGEGYIRFSAFNQREKVIEAMQRIQTFIKP